MDPRHFASHPLLGHVQTDRPPSTVYKAAPIGLQESRSKASSERAVPRQVAPVACMVRGGSRQALENDNNDDKDAQGEDAEIELWRDKAGRRIGRQDSAVKAPKLLQPAKVQTSRAPVNAASEKRKSRLGAVNGPTLDFQRLDTAIAELRTGYPNRKAMDEWLLDVEVSQKAQSEPSKPPAEASDKIADGNKDDSEIARAEQANLDEWLVEGTLSKAPTPEQCVVQDELTQDVGLHDEDDDLEDAEGEYEDPKLWHSSPLAATARGTRAFPSHEPASSHAARHIPESPGRRPTKRPREGA